MADAKLLVKKCSCVHDYQDRLYGAGMRLHNPSGKKDGVDKCSVCGTRQSDRKFASPSGRYTTDTADWERTMAPKKK